MIKHQLWAALFFLGSLGSAKADGRFLGPVGIENQYPYSLAYTGSAPDTAQTLQEGELKTRVGFAWTNTSVYQRHFTTDVETRTYLLSGSYGIGGDVDLSIGAPIIWRGGGTLDHFIQQWHESFNLPEGRRPDVDKNHYEISGVQNDHDSYDYHASGTDLGKVWLAAKRELSGLSEIDTWSLNFRLGLPTATGDSALRGLDLVPSLLYTTAWNRTALYSGISGVYLSDTHVSGVPYTRAHMEGFSQFEYRWLDSLSAILGAYGGSGVLKDVTGHPDYFLYLDAGVHVIMSETFLMEVLLRENPTPGRGTADITFYLGFSARIL